MDLIYIAHLLITGWVGWTLSSVWDLPWCIGGNLNVTTFLSERLGGSDFTPPMVDFFNIISKQNLQDIPLARGSFTWSSNQDHPSWSRLDRFLISPDWEEHCSDLIQERRPTFYSDHFSILLDCEGLHRGSWYFKFENVWLKFEGFLDGVQQWWSSYLPIFWKSKLYPRL